MESLSKSRIQGVWDPAHSTRVGITFGCAATFHQATATFHPAALPFTSGYAAITPGCQKIYIRLPPLYTRMYHIRLPPHSIRLSPLYTRMYHIRKSAATAISSRCLASEIQELDGRGGRFNFSGQTYSDLPIALTRRISQQFCTVPRCSPKASQYVR